MKAPGNGLLPQDLFPEFYGSRYRSNVCFKLVSVLKVCYSEVPAKDGFLPSKNSCRREQEFVLDN